MKSGINGLGRIGKLLRPTLATVQAATGGTTAPETHSAPPWKEEIPVTPSPSVRVKGIITLLSL